MAENENSPNKPNISPTVLVLDEHNARSCKMNKKNKTEFMCEQTSWSGKYDTYIDKKISPQNIFEKRFPESENNSLLGYLNNRGDLLVDARIAWETQLIIPRKMLYTNRPPKGSTVEKLDPDNEHSSNIILTPEGRVWIPQEERELDASEIMQVIQRKLASIEKGKEKISMTSPVAANLDTLALKTGYDSDSSWVA